MHRKPTMTGFARQTLVIWLLAVRAWTARLSTVAIAVFSFAIVAAIVVSVLALTTAISNLYARSGAADVALVLGSGAFAESGSVVSSRVVDRLVQAMEGDDPAGRVSPELLVTTELARDSDGSTLSVPVRGVSEAAARVHPQVVLVAGRYFGAGLNEVVVGTGVAEVVAGTGLGREVMIGNQPFKVVGLFTANGGIRESGIVGDISRIGEATGVPGRISSVYVKLRNPARFDAFADSLRKIPGLGIDVFREDDYLSRQGGQYRKLVMLPGAFIALIIAIAAMLASVNTMQGAVHARLREIATLRALGFGALAVAIAVVLEAALIGCIGGGIGAGAVRLVLQGRSLVTSNGLNAVAMEMDVRAGAMLAAVGLAVAAGVVGGAWPALGAARTNVADAIRRT